MNWFDDEDIIIDNLEPVQSIDVLDDEAVITINGIETLEYTISDEKVVTVVLEYQDDFETKTFDFSKKLYGIYQYTFVDVDKTVTINYVGNNADLLKDYVNVVDVTKKIICDDVECTISGFGTEKITVSDVTSGYYDLASFENDYNAKVSITNNDLPLDSTDIIINGSKLEIVDNQDDSGLVNTTPKSIYEINRVGDVFVPSDGLIDLKDQKQIVDDILLENSVSVNNDLNEDGILNILDATHSTFIEFDGSHEIVDVLTNNLVADKTEALIGDKIKVELFVNGFDKLSLYGFEGLLNYDDTILELAGAKIYSISEEDELDILGYLNLDNNKLAYVLKNAFNRSDVALITFEFDAIAAGSVDVSISDIIESYGDLFEVTNDNVSVTINVLENGTGGDTPEDLPNDDDSNKEDEKQEEEEIVKPIVKPVVLSSDYYIKNLNILGYNIDFNMYTYEYTVKVKNDVNSLDFDVLLNDNNSIYYVEGNENFKEGENLVYLVVKAQNGSTKTYTIKVLKEKEEIAKNENKDEVIDEEDKDDEVTKKSSTSKTIIIILIILVIIGLIYLIFKDDEEDKNDVKINQVKKDDNSKKKTEQKNTNSTVKKSPKKGNKR